MNAQSIKLNSFDNFNINKHLLKRLNDKKITVPTQIQQQVIPKILNQQDVIAQSKTGTGKTIAYLIPLLHLLLNKKKNVDFLINNWKNFIKFEKISIYFVNLNTNQNWIIYPYTHEKICGEKNLNKGIMTLFGSVSKV